MPGILTETIQYVLDKTVSCSVEPTELIIRTLALIGMMHLGGAMLSGIGKVFAYPLIYTWGLIKWIYNKFKGRTI